MSQHLDTPFDPTLLSGYLDGELTQAEAQRVRLRLEDDADARRLLAEMQSIREAARSTELATPRDEEWNEAPRSSASRWFRRSGWVLLVAWGTVLAGLMAWGFLVGPDTWWQKIVAVTLIGGPLLLLLSVLMDRVQAMKHDRYGRVEK